MVFVFMLRDVKLLNIYRSFSRFSVKTQLQKVHKVRIQNTLYMYAYIWEEKTPNSKTNAKYRILNSELDLLART